MKASSEYLNNPPRSYEQVLRDQTRDHVPCCGCLPCTELAELHPPALSVEESRRIAVLIIG